ncbi:MAG: hypothetical protein GY786_22100 [Proteobacteria bacterium]|nr:hypothetical protein [Pseudomonadota bacterium]
MKIPYLFLGALLIWGQPILGQIVTSSIDPGLPSETPSAISWRFGSAVAIESTYGERYYVYDAVGTHNIHNSGLFTWQPSQVSIELYSRVNEIIDSVDSSTDTFFETRGSQSYFSIAVRGENRVSVGIIARQNEQTSPLTFSESSFGGSFSARVFDGLFMAVGLERVSSSGTGFETVRWEETKSGIAYLVGDPFSTMLRIELGVSSSPEVKDDVLKIRNQTKMVSKGEIELLLANYLFSFRGKIKDLGSGTNAETTRSARFGIGYRGTSFSLVYYFDYGEEEINSKIFSESKYLFNISYSFM